MPTHDYIISNGTGAAVRADINSALSAIVSLNSSASEPATMYAYQLWADTTNGLLKIRNSANSAWITLRQLDGDFSIVAVEDGLQATPSLTFTNDLNTGIFRPGNDSLAIVSGGTRSITITSTQAVGIQTANPNAPLHVAGVARIGADDATDATVEIGAGATGNRNAFIDLVGDTTYTDYGVRFIRNNTGANATSEIKHRGTGNFNITTQEASAIEFSTTNTPRVTITSGGLVGLGTSNPTTKLHVVVSVEDPTTGAPGSTSFVQVRGDTTTVGYGPSIALSNVSGAKETFWRISAVTASANNGDLVFNGYNGGATYPERLRITAGGLVGIGTTSPNNKLDVSGSISATGAFSNSGFAPHVHLGVVGGNPCIASGNNVASTFLPLVFRQETSNTAGEAMRIDASGRLLVGTATQVGNANGGILQLGSGITFPATAVAASDANTLDDYEEGTWTPSDGSGAGRTFTNLGSSYVKIGRKVTVIAYFLVDVSVSAAGFQVNGLPFTSTSTLGQNVGTFGSSTGTAGISTLGVSSTSVAVGTPATYNTNLTNTQVSNGGVAFTLNYLV